MSSRYKGSILSATAATNSQSAAVGVWRPNEVLQAVNASLWPLGITYDPYFKYVTLLLHGDGTNGAQNNTFLDSSSNNFTITRNGNTTQGTFSPYGSNWSSYFDGTSYASISGGVTNVGTGDICAECWVNYTGTYADYNFIFDSRTSAGSFTDGISFAVNVTNGYFYFGQTSQDILTSIVCQKNTWYHVCVTRQSGVFRMFINGVLGGTVTLTSNLSSTANRIGWYYGATTSYKFPGYISNFRVTKSSVPTAYQTSSTTVGATIFTPPTTLLTTTSQGASGTSLLTLQNNNFVDNSSNAFTVSTTNSPSIQRFSPFSPSTAYSTSVIGGSGYFDGSSSLSTSSSNTALPTGTQDFSVELWVYWATQSGTYPQIIANPVTNGFQIYYDVGAGALSVGIFNVANVITYTISQATLNNTWNHIAITRSGNTFRLFVNGVLRSNGTNTISYAALTTQYVGSDGSRPYTGYITDVRTVLGSIPTAYQTSSTTNGTVVFTPSTTPLTTVSGTALLLNYTNGGIYDNAMMNDLTTVGSAQVSTTQVKFGTGSMYFNGSGSYLNEPSSQNFAFGGDFTVEGWVYLTANIANAQGGYLTDFRGGSTNNFALGFIGASSVTKMYAFIGSPGLDTTGTATVTLNTWNHVAYVRSGSTVTLYLNGTSNGTLSASYAQGATNAVICARYTGSTEYVTGYVDDLRITKGYARYTSNFTPPTTAFPNQ